MVKLVVTTKQAVNRRFKSYLGPAQLHEIELEHARVRQGPEGRPHEGLTVHVAVAGGALDPAAHFLVKSGVQTVVNPWSIK